jgi:hypothetical protein
MEQTNIKEVTEEVTVTETAPKVKRPRGRPRKENMPTPVERQREYRKCPEFREKHRLRCASYNARMRAMREFCKENNIEV